MENKFLIDLSIKYGLDSSQVSKVVDIVYQAGNQEVDSRGAKRVAGFICKMGLVDKPAEEIIEELKRKGLMKE